MENVLPERLAAFYNILSLIGNVATKKTVRRMLYASDLRVIHIFVCNKLCTCINFLLKSSSQLFLTKINFKKITVNSLRSFTCDVHKKLDFGLLIAFRMMFWGSK